MDRIERIAGRDDHPPYWLAGAADDPASPLLVAVHGISRNAEAHARAFHETARRCGWTVMAPLFDATRYPDYQRLGRRGRRADLGLLAALADLEARRGRPVRRFSLFGFSGGAQFAHRFALAWPHLVDVLLLAAAGWYTMPDPDLRYPYGLAPCRRLPDLVFRLEPFLRRPIRVFVGSEDIERDETVRSGSRLDALQGTNRLERARRWCAALETAAHRRGLAVDVVLQLLPGAGHDFAACVDPARGRLVERIFTELCHVSAEKESLPCAA